jgi:hypothetical protein
MPRHELIQLEKSTDWYYPYGNIEQVISPIRLHSEEGIIAFTTFTTDSSDLVAFAYDSTSPPMQRWAVIALVSVSMIDDTLEHISLDGGVWFARGSPELRDWLRSVVAAVNSEMGAPVLQEATVEQIAAAEYRPGSYEGTHVMVWSRPRQVEPIDGVVPSEYVSLRVREAYGGRLRLSINYYRSTWRDAPEWRMRSERMRGHDAAGTREATGR